MINVMASVSIVMLVNLAMLSAQVKVRRLVMLFTLVTLGLLNLIFLITSVT